MSAEADVPVSMPVREPAAHAWLARAALAVAGSALLLLVAVQAWQVVARYLLNDSPGWTEPVSVLCMTTAMMLGAAVAVRDDRHFSFQLLLHRLPPAMARLLRVAIQLAIAAAGALLAGWGSVLATDLRDVRTAGAPMSLGLLYLPVVAGGALILLFALARVPQVWRRVEAD